LGAQLLDLHRAGRVALRIDGRGRSPDNLE
jgi:hypothetical protein